MAYDKLYEEDLLRICNSGKISHHQFNLLKQLKPTWKFVLRRKDEKK